MEGLVLDLRGNNGGGILKPHSAIASKPFLDDQEIVKVVDKLVTMKTVHRSSAGSIDIPMSGIGQWG